MKTYNIELALKFQYDIQAKNEIEAIEQATTLTNQEINEIEYPEFEVQKSNIIN